MEVERIERLVSGDDEGDGVGQRGQRVRVSLVIPKSLEQSCQHWPSVLPFRAVTGIGARPCACSLFIFATSSSCYILLGRPRMSCATEPECANISQLYIKLERRKMSDSASVIRISGLTKLDLLELGDEFPAGSVKFEDQKMAGNKVGEPTTVVIIILSLAAITALSLWLLKNRKSEKIEKTIEITDKNGIVHRETIRVDISSSSAPQADVVKELMRLTKFDASSLGDGVV
jgi:hypothetical protein